MSGGSLNYGYFQIEQLADELEALGNPRWAKFEAHLRLVAKAAHDVEWVESSDYGECGADEALDMIGCKP